VLFLKHCDDKDKSKSEVLAPVADFSTRSEYTKKPHLIQHTLEFKSAKPWLSPDI